ncbi:caspase family protein [Candidatus Reidiella endopervernicosa]|uniref:Caspase family protein n=1 Tax=Candidatus Reidiella endopervernicosa TaxID=2738883 RepID=A0A6N0HSX2_9GAMM|nr:caspase family protein [Candidatus Reidiella endopervernicosa]QKQ25380.1 caspase family protein [Candidatus Reidiella endopervernicosa]
MFAILSPAQAAPPTEPILRVETGMHTTLIRRLVVDAPRQRLISCSDDKTIRIWQMPEQRLLSTLRVPIDSGHEGQLFALAVSPDGNSVAAAGWTGWDWNGAASIYLFDVVSGELVRTLDGFKDAISALAWSPDGAHLAVGLQGRAGLAVVRLADGKVVARDSGYLDKLMDLDFSRSGRLAAVSLDGMTRLYSRDFKLVGRRKIPGGKQPISIRFSPDAAKIAIGFVDAAAVAVVSARNLELAFHPDQTGLVDQQSIFTVTWSSEGDYLYASGDYRGAGRNPVYRWSEGGRGALERIPAALNRITEIQQMPSGRIVFAAEDPGFGIIAADGSIESFRGPDILDYSRDRERLLLSEDGLTVAYPVEQGTTKLHHFSALMGGAQKPAESRVSETLHPPQRGGARFKVEQWLDDFRPKINGKVPALDDYEMARSYAIAPDGQQLLLGTEWSLRLLDERVQEQWSVALASVAWSVNISRDGRVAVAALSDGTIRWYDMRDGSPLFAYFPHRDGEEWIAWLPSGYYISSIHGDNFVGWHVNRGERVVPDFHRAVQFDRILYRPDLFKAAITQSLGIKTRALQRTVGRPEFEISQLAKIAPPRIRLQLGRVKLHEGHAVLTLQISAEKNSLQMRDVTVFINHIPVTPTSERVLSESESERFSKVVEIPLSQHHNEIRVEAFNGISMGVAEHYLVLPEALDLKPQQGDLYLLAVGVNKFPSLSEDAALAYAANDAEGFEQALRDRGGKVFRRVHTRLINDASANKPDRATIREALAFIHQAQPEDTVILFLASHGISDEAGNYYFVPRDAVEADLDRLIDGGEIESLMPWTTFFESLRLTAGRRLLMVDTCQARNIEGRFEAHSLMKRSASSLFSLMLASKGDEESQEYPNTRHGLFTHSVLAAMSESSDSNADGQLTLRELFAGAAPIVESQRDKRIGPQTPQLIAPSQVEDFPLVSVGE